MLCNVKFDHIHETINIIINEKSSIFIEWFKRYDKSRLPYGRTQ